MKAIILILLFTTSIFCQFQAEQLDGGYTLIKYDPTDQTQQLVLKQSQEAIQSQLQLSSSQFDFIKVLKLETQVVEGINYRMTLLYGNQQRQKKLIQTIVWSQPWLNNYQVTSVKDLTVKLPQMPQSGMPKIPKIGTEPSFEQLENQKPFQAAVDEIKNKYSEELVGYTVTNGQLISTQVVAGMMYTYKITFTKEGGIPFDFQAQVWSKPWENFFQVVQIIPGNRRNLAYGGWQDKTMDPTNPEDALVIKTLYDYIGQHQELGMTDYKIHGFQNVQTEVVSGTNYKLDILFVNADTNKFQLVQAIVWAQFWLNTATVTQFNLVDSFTQ